MVSGFSFENYGGDLKIGLGLRLLFVDYLVDREWFGGIRRRNFFVNKPHLQGLFKK